MKQWLTALAVLGAWGAQSASAQLGTYTPPQVSPPYFSPYMNMLRNNPAANYFGIVQQQFDTRGQLMQLQQDLRYTQAGMYPGMLGMPGAQGDLFITGRPVVFQNTMQYFPQGNSLAGVGMGVGGYPGAGGGIAGGGYPTQTINNTPLPQGFMPR